MVWSGRYMVAKKPAGAGKPELVIDSDAAAGAAIELALKEDGDKSVAVRPSSARVEGGGFSSTRVDRRASSGCPSPARVERLPLPGARRGARA